MFSRTDQNDVKCQQSRALTVLYSGQSSDNKPKAREEHYRRHIAMETIRDIRIYFPDTDPVPLGTAKLGTWFWHSTPPEIALPSVQWTSNEKALTALNKVVRLNGRVDSENNPYFDVRGTLTELTMTDYSSSRIKTIT